MKSSTWIIVGLLMAGTAMAQQIDFESMSNGEFLRYLEQRDAPAQQNNIEQVTPGVKCPLDLTFEIIRRRDMMSGSELIQLNKLTAPPTYQKTIMSPSGRFKVHYDTVGLHAPAMLDISGFRIESTYDQYASEVAAMFDYVYEKEVIELGYDAPPNPPYEVYLYDEGVGNYGATYPVQQLPSNTNAPVYTTYIRMDNDFRQYYKPGLDGARVTAAHEFHHMIQLGKYGSYGNPDRYIYEMTSTHFEDVVYPDVNDYYQYLPDHFDLPHLSFYTPVGVLIGYQKAIFIQMLEKKYGAETIRQCWENMKQVDPANAVNQALVAAGSDYARELCGFGRWCYYTGFRAENHDIASRFDEAGAFPLVEYEGLTQLNGGRTDFADELPPFASMYFRTYRGADTVSVIVSNTDWGAAIPGGIRGYKTPFSISVVDYQPGDPYTPLSNGWAYKFESGAANLFCVTAVVGEAAEEAPISTPYPNPFYPESDGAVRFPMPAVTQQQRANLYIYTASMNLVYHKDEAPIQSEEGLGRFLQWDGRTDSGDIPPTGVYMYSIKFGDDVRKGKFAVVRR